MSEEHNVMRNDPSQRREVIFFYKWGEEKKKPVLEFIDNRIDAHCWMASWPNLAFL